MVDIHCHILPGVDDGAENIEEALQMLWKSARAGVETIVATPHILSGVYNIDFSERQRLTAELQKIADSNGINIQIKSGVEYYLSPEMLEDTDKLTEFTINNNGKYILVELPIQTFPPFVECSLVSFMGGNQMLKRFFSDPTDQMNIDEGTWKGFVITPPRRVDKPTYEIVGPV